MKRVLKIFGVSFIACALALTVFSGFSGCDSKASAGGRKKGFNLKENLLRSKLQEYFAYKQCYPESLYDLDDEYYQVPDPPEGYWYDYDDTKGIVIIRPFNEKEMDGDKE